MRIIIINYYYNYNSFIYHPFRVVYSGALPAQPRSSNVVLRPERTRAEQKESAGIRCSSTGRSFQAIGTATEKVYVLSDNSYSFITEIYIAPLQGYYSEALPTLARLKRRVLRLE